MAKLKSGTRIYGSGTVDTKLLVGSTTDTGTASQNLQITGGVYVSGNVGIGTTNPGSTLDVRSSTVTIRSQNTTNNYSVLVDGNSSGPRVSFGSDGSNSFLEFGAYSNLNNLDTKSRDLKIFSTSAPNAFYLQASTGNIGINSTLPTSTLTVQGNSLFTGILTARNAETQDSISLNGRAGGTSSFNLSLTPTTLAASRTVTFQDVSGTVYVSGGTDIPLADGGTNASLTASNGGIVYSTATAMAILSGTATAGQILRSGASEAPSWSTATYPATTTANQILFSSDANTIAGITTENTAVLITNSSAVPSLLSGTTANRLLKTNGTAVSWSQASLTTDVTGTLPIANGGTNSTSTPTNGGVAYGNGSAYTFTSAGTAGQVLTSNGAGAPTWGDAPGGFSVTDDTSTNSTYYPVFVDTTSGDPTQTSVSSTKLNFNPSTGNFSSTQFTSLSDATKKTNIRPIENPIELTKQLEGVRFEWIDNNKPSLGLIAQEVEKVLPELVETNSDGIKSVSYSNMVGLLIEAIKEQQVRIEELERKLNA